MMHLSYNGNRKLSHVLDDTIFSIYDFFAAKPQKKQV